MFLQTHTAQDDVDMGIFQEMGTNRQRRVGEINYKEFRTRLTQEIADSKRRFGSKTETDGHGTIYLVVHLRMALVKVGYFSRKF